MRPAGRGSSRPTAFAAPVPVGEEDPPDRGPWSLGWGPRRADAHRMAWFFRAIEQADGRWACSHGGAVFDQHDELPDALVHLRDIAATMSPAELFVHHLDGDVKNVGSV